jgi:hypothetical protein
MPRRACPAAKAQAYVGISAQVSAPVYALPVEPIFTWSDRTESARDVERHR